METVPGRIEKDGRVVAGELQITLDTVTEPSGLKSWYGRFLARAEHALEPDQYELVLADGRRGTILITKMTITGGAWCRSHFKAPARSASEGLTLGKRLKLTGARQGLFQYEVGYCGDAAE